MLAIAGGFLLALAILAAASLVLLGIVWVLRVYLELI